MDIPQTLQWARGRLKEAQLQAARNGKATLEARGFDYDYIINQINSAETNAISSDFYLSIPIDKRLRFLDMKRIAGVPVYNRPVWGVLMGGGDSLKTRLLEQLGNEALQTLKNSIQAN